MDVQAALDQYKASSVVTKEELLSVAQGFGFDSPPPKWSVDMSEVQKKYFAQYYCGLFLPWGPHNERKHYTKFTYKDFEQFIETTTHSALRYDASLLDTIRKVSGLRSCARCGKIGKQHRCARCRKVRYCGRHCQKAHWAAGHKQVCKSLRN